MPRKLIAGTYVTVKDAAPAAVKTKPQPKEKPVKPVQK